MGGGSLQEAPPSLPGRTRGAGGETKGSGQGGPRALVSRADPAIVSLGASEGMEANTRLAGLLEGQGWGPSPSSAWIPGEGIWVSQAQQDAARVRDPEGATTWGRGLTRRGP